MNKHDKQELMIDAALEVFCEKGYANTRMADIAARAGVSYGLVYHYFESKEAFFDNIVERWWNTFYEILEAEKNSSKGFQQKLENIIQFFLDTYSNKFNLLSIFVTEVSRSSLYRTERGLARFRKSFALFDEIMSKGQESGYFRIVWGDSGIGNDNNYAVLYEGTAEPPPPPTNVKAMNRYSQGIAGASLRQVDITWNEEPTGNTYGFHVYMSQSNSYSGMSRLTSASSPVKTNHFEYNPPTGDTDQVMYFAVKAALASGAEGEFSNIAQNMDP